MNEQQTQITRQGAFKVVPFDEPVSPRSDPTYEKINLTSLDKMQLSALMSQMPALSAAESMSGMYRVVFPNGMEHALTALKQGGVSSFFKDAEGKYAGTASLYGAGTQALVLGAFTVMSVACSQYFLAEINKEMTLINEKIDKILEFLYGDKKAELLAEISFARYAYDNYASIMKYAEQRTATLASLQEARKIAMKDIEFYLGDLTSLSQTKTKNAMELHETVEKSIRAHDSLMLSSQLFTMSTLLEVFYSQNTEETYLKYIEESNAAYLTKCDKSANSAWSTILFRVKEAASKAPAKSPLKAPGYLQSITDRMDALNIEQSDKSRKQIHEILETMNAESELVLDPSGEAYMKRVS